MYYAFSTMVCTPASISQEVGLALGAQAGEKQLAEVLSEGGFSRVRKAAATPFNVILEARPWYPDAACGNLTPGLREWDYQLVFAGDSGLHPGRARPRVA